MDFLNASDERDRDRELFVRAQLAFFLLGAIDGHAKNFSVFLTRTGFFLTPIYDVMTIYPALHARQIEPKQAKLSMCVGDNRHYLLREIRRKHWEQTAKVCGFPNSRLAALRDELVQKSEGLEDFIRTLEPRVPTSLAEPLIQGVLDAVKRL